MAATATVLSLADLEAFDPQAPDRDGERRFLCPLGGPCDGKPRDASHRSLSVDMQSGRWNCPRCGSAGCLKDFWEQKERQETGAFGRSKPTSGRSTFSPLRATETPSAPAVKAESAEKLRRTLAAGDGLQPLEGSPGADYLNGRTLSVEIAAAAGVKWHPDWLGGGAVVYPAYNAAGELVAAEGRYVDGRDDPKTRCVGQKSLGWFATPGVWESPVVGLVEGFADALTLAAFGLPTICVFGSPLLLPPGLARKLFRKRVLIASDADEKGDQCAACWADEVQGSAAKPIRFRPPVGKDWNDCLERDPELVAEAVREWVVPDSSPSRSVPPPVRPAAPPAPRPTAPVPVEPVAVAPIEVAALQGSPFPQLPATPLPCVEEWAAAPLPEAPPELESSAPPAVRAYTPRDHPDDVPIPRSEWPEDGPPDTFAEIRLARFQEQWHEEARQERLQRQRDEEEASAALPVNVNRTEETPSAARLGLDDLEDLPGVESALLVLVATPAPTTGEGVSLAWDYLRTWVSATYLASGPGVGAFYGVLPDAERSELRAVWETLALTVQPWRDAETEDPEAAKALLMATVDAAYVVTEQAGAAPEDVGCYLRAMTARQEERLNARQGATEAEPVGTKRKRRKVTEPQWDAETARVVAWLENWTPPAAPFALHPWVIITAPAAYVQALRAEANAGPLGIRARTGALQEDLAALWALFGGKV